MSKERLLGMAGRAGSWELPQPSQSAGWVGFAWVKAVQKRCQGEIRKEFGATPVQKSA